jgi:hypothetical protein
VKAWILQWVPADVADHPLAEANPRSRTDVVYIASSRISHQQIELIGKAIYLAEIGEPNFLLAVHRLERAKQPYPGMPAYAEIEADVTGELEHVRFVGRFRFGRDPCLYGRQVENLREREDGTLDWSEIPIPPIPAAPAR